MQAGLRRACGIGLSGQICQAHLDADVGRKLAGDCTAQAHAERSASARPLPRPRVYQSLPQKFTSICVAAAPERWVSCNRTHAKLCSGAAPRVAKIGGGIDF